MIWRFLRRCLLLSALPSILAAPLAHAVTRVVVTGGWSDKAKEAVAANALIDQGADVVTMHVDSPATVILKRSRTRTVSSSTARGRVSICRSGSAFTAASATGWRRCS